MRAILQRAAEIEAVLSAYAPDCQPQVVESLGGAGGFSGAKLWRLTANRGTLCLRRWPPEHPDRARLEWIHRVVEYVSSSGFQLLPVPIPTASGQTFLEHEGSLWELTKWMSGEANYWCDPRPEKLRAAMTELATFHRLAQTNPAASSSVDLVSSGAQRAPSPGIAERLAMARRLQGGGMMELRLSVAANRHTFPELANQADKLLAIVTPQQPLLENELQEASHVQVALQPCLRDIWHDHVLFSGDQVSGMIDLGSMRVESVAADVSRLLGSLCANDKRGWSIGLDAYEAVRPLTADEYILLGAFDYSQMLLSGINWVQWVFVEKRAFSDPGAVLQRMEHILARLSNQTVQITAGKRNLTGLLD